MLELGEHQLVLQHVTLQSSGTYSCQITLSGPPFDTVTKEKLLSVYGKFLDNGRSFINSFISITITDIAHNGI